MRKNKRSGKFLQPIDAITILSRSGSRVGKNRVLRLMRAHGLLAPQRQGHPHGDPAHAGTITTERPNQMWGTGR